MIEFTPHPILFSIGPLAIRFYSLAYLLGFIATYYWLKRRWGQEHAENLLLWIVLATIIGGRLGEFIFYSPSTFWTNPLEIVYIWHGGMSFHGAIIALTAAVYVYARRHKLLFWALADTITVPATIGIILGRIANFLNGELIGTVTNVPWCVTLPEVSGCRHPNPLYESLYTAVILVVVVMVSRVAVKKKLQDGLVFVTFVLAYGVFRFLENFFREDWRFLGISTGQYLCIFMAAWATWMLCTKYKNSVRMVFS